jgi:hypothetical protein
MPDGAMSVIAPRAQELGFEVLELNPSIDRSANRLPQLCGEAMLSQRITHVDPSRPAADAAVATTAKANGRVKAVAAAGAV